MVHAPNGTGANWNRRQMVHKPIKDYHEKIKVNGQTIEFSDEAKYLGITLDSRLNWNSQ
jgi:hypothetical protein